MSFSVAQQCVTCVRVSFVWHGNVDVLNLVIYSVCRQMKTRPGEALIDCLDSIEDTKGNNGDRGMAAKLQRTDLFSRHLLG